MAFTLANVLLKLNDSSERCPDNQVKRSNTHMKAQMDGLRHGMKRLYRAESTSDLTIVCGERTWKVHKFCLSAQSDYFFSACYGNFSEATRHEIALHDENPAVLDAFIYHLYHFDYTASIGNSSSLMVFHVRMYVIADQYLVWPLRALAAETFDKSAKAFWSSAAFAEAVIEVYATTEGGRTNPLKESVIEVVKQHAKELLDPSQHHGDLLNTLRTTPELASQVSDILAMAGSGDGASMKSHSSSKLVSLHTLQHHLATLAAQRH